MKIRLNADYRGVLTNERFYPAGTYEVDLDIPGDTATALIRAGRAEEVEVARADTENPARPAPKRKRGGL